MDLASILPVSLDVSTWPPLTFIILCVLFLTLGVVAFMLAPLRARYQAQKIIRDFDQLTVQLTQGERMGHFGSFYWDTDNGDSRWSDELFELFGLHIYRKAPKPSWISTVVVEKERANFAKNWAYATTHTGPFDIVAPIVKPDGAQRHLRLTGHTTERPNGSFEISGVAHDISKEVEVDRAKSEFVSIASHQLKTPLTSIGWLAESLVNSPQSSTLTPDQFKYISSILQTSRRMMEMVNDLLNVSRIELGVLVVRPEDLDIKMLLDSVYQEQKKTIDDKHQEFVMKIEPGLQHVHVDKGFMRMILQNLITNAVKYTPPNGTVTVDIQKDVSMHVDVMVIKVVDTGIGIPLKDQENVFTRMYRASNAQATVADGTGLGLYVIKSIVEHVKGKISFISSENKGTTFFVTVPLVWEATHTPTSSET